TITNPAPSAMVGELTEAMTTVERPTVADEFIVTNPEAAFTEAISKTGTPVVGIVHLRPAGIVMVFSVFVVWFTAYACAVNCLVPLGEILAINGVTSILVSGKTST